MCTVVVGTDFSPAANDALTAVQRMVARFGVRRVHLVHVVESRAWVGPHLEAYGELLAMAESAARERLARYEWDMGPSVEITREVRVGAPAKQLSEAADQVGASMLVLSSHGHSAFSRVVLGSVTSSVVRVCHVPVLVVPASSPTSILEPECQVLAAVDLSPVSRRVMKEASAWADAVTDGSLHVMSTYDHPVATLDEGDLLPHFVSSEEIERMGVAVRQEVDRLVRKHGPKRAPVQVEVLSRAPAAQVILDISAIIEADLVVVGTSGHSILQRILLGATATRVLHEAQRPVLVIPQAQTEAAYEQEEGHIPVQAVV